MTNSAPDRVTGLLLAWSEGEQSALKTLVSLLYPQLRQLAHEYMRRERPGHTLQTTALVNEAYLRLIDSSRVDWQGRAHFLAVSAQLMRRILVDSARSRGCLKRGGKARQIPLDGSMEISQELGPDLIALDDALRALRALDARKGKVVELRFFGGLTVEESAKVLNVSPDTVMRDWKLSRAWLARALSEGTDAAS